MNNVEKINRFLGDYNFLSNFSRSYIRYNGEVYDSIEHAFQAAKTFDIKMKSKIKNAPSPGTAKYLGRRCKLREDWEDVKDGIMEELVRMKFTLDRELRMKLLRTGDAYLEDGNCWHETYWGVDDKTGKGLNKLGHILMKVRDELRKG